MAAEILTTPVFEKNSVVIYPNPVRESLQIHTPNNKVITEAKIIALDGQTVQLKTKNSNYINVENLAKGIYILEVQSGEDKYLSKFIKE